MKGIISFILVGICALSLVACGDKMDRNSADSYIGTWESKNMRFKIEKGGVGRYDMPNTEEVGFYDFTYEVKDEVLTLTIKGTVDWVTTLELNEDGTSLIMCHNGLPRFADETEFQRK